MYHKFFCEIRTLVKRENTKSVFSKICKRWDVMKGCGERGVDGNEAMIGAKGNCVRSAECGRGMLVQRTRRRVNACLGGKICMHTNATGKCACKANSRSKTSGKRGAQLYTDVHHKANARSKTSGKRGAQLHTDVRRCTSENMHAAITLYICVCMQT